MNEKSRRLRNFTIALFISLLFNIGMAIHIGHHHSNPETIIKTEVKFDTIVHFKYNTDTIHVKDTLFRNKTIIVNDTVYVERRYNDFIFNDPYYTLFVNAIDVKKYKLDIHKTDTITFTKEIEIPIYVKPKKPIFYYGIGLGVGYGLFTKKPDLYIGMNAGFRF